MIKIIVQIQKTLIEIKNIKSIMMKKISEPCANQKVDVLGMAFVFLKNPETRPPSSQAIKFNQPCDKCAKKECPSDLRVVNGKLFCKECFSSHQKVLAKKQTEKFKPRYKYCLFCNKKEELKSDNKEKSNQWICDSCKFKDFFQKRNPNKDCYFSKNNMGMANPFQKKKQRASFQANYATIQTRRDMPNQIKDQTIKNPLRQTTNDFTSIQNQIQKNLDTPISQKTPKINNSYQPFKMNRTQSYTTLFSQTPNPIKDGNGKISKNDKGKKDQKERFNTEIFRNQTNPSQSSGDKSQLRKENYELNKQICCIICMDKKRDCINTSCFHMVCCMECGSKVKKCPICYKKMVPQKVYL